MHCHVFVLVETESRTAAEWGTDADYSNTAPQGPKICFMHDCLFVLNLTVGLHESGEETACSSRALPEAKDLLRQRPLVEVRPEQHDGCQEQDPQQRAAPEAIDLRVPAHSVISACHERDGQGKALHVIGPCLPSQALCCKTHS